MPSGSSERGVSSKGGAPPPETEQLQCPRCDSTNTKFCYYNNYNFSQPRHFCKSCRRYWTHGGTLRDVPVGGGSRKNAKRSRTMHVTSSGSTATSLSFSSSAHSSDYRDYCHVPGTGTSTSAFLAPLTGNHGGGAGGMNVCGTFTSLLNTQGPGLFALGGIGLGLGSSVGLDDMGFGFGRQLLPFPGGTGAGAGNTWQMQSGGGGDCFTLPDVAIGHGMK